MHEHSAIRLEYDDERDGLDDLADINATLLPNGTRIWPRVLSDEPDDIRTLLAKQSLDASESERLLQHFLLSRERLLEIVHEAGRSPEATDGGALSTTDVTHDVTYPQLYLVEPGIDYSRFDRLHVNAADNGDGVDEVLTGKRVRAHYGNDPGSDEPPTIRYYVWDAAKKAYDIHVIDEGTVGIGLQIRTADIDGDGDIDIAVPGKEGTQILFNQSR